MRRLILAAAAATAVCLASTAAVGADARDPDAAILVKGGLWDSGVSDVDMAGAYGAELSADDPFIQPSAAGKLRHMLSANHSASDDLTLTTVEWNAHWMIQAGTGFWVGGGPGIGYLWADGRDTDDGLGLQLGVSSYTTMQHAILGIEARYQWVESSAADNWLTMVKLGYRF